MNSKLFILNEYCIIGCTYNLSRQYEIKLFDSFKLNFKIYVKEMKQPDAQQEQMEQIRHPEPGPPPKKTTKRKTNVKTHVSKKNITLTEDHFGTIYDECGRFHHVKRFTWRNHNNIQVQIITYGARITSICVPDRKGNVEDIVLGFDDVAGYLYYDDLLFGATVGRVSDFVENATFVIDGKQYWVTNNDEKHHKDGGYKGLDKINWRHYVDGTKVLLSHVSRNKEEGFPGDLLILLTFELNSKNEFSVQMEATTTKPTIVNLSNMMYFNLAGHQAGAEEIYRHTLTINANCFLTYKNNGLPDGNIVNVVNTRNDFMVPRYLKHLLTDNPNDGYEQYFCINRAVNQTDCFMSRLLHTPSGRIMEIYSNQPGIKFTTSNNLGLGLVNLPVKLIDSSCIELTESDTDPFDLINKLHNKVKNQLKLIDDDNYSELRKLIRKLHRRTFMYADLTSREDRDIAFTLNETNEEEEAQEENTEEEQEIEDTDDFKNIKLSPVQRKYLQCLQGSSVQSLTDYSEIKSIIGKILEATEELKGNSSVDGRVAFDVETSGENIQTVIEDEEAKKSKKEMEKLEADLKRKQLIKPTNQIPSYYKDGRIHGKSNVIYKRHCAVTLQTQNYPNAIYHQNFPNCILTPGETYKHTVVYKFWNQKGNPNAWIKRNVQESRKESEKNLKRSNVKTDN